jgi:hypothetical protein
MRLTCTIHDGLRVSEKSALIEPVQSDSLTVHEQSLISEGNSASNEVVVHRDINNETNIEDSNNDPAFELNHYYKTQIQSTMFKPRKSQRNRKQH